MHWRPRWFALLAGFCSAAVVSGWVSRWHREVTPLASPPVVSFATIHGYHPLANLVPYFAGLVLAVGVPLGLARLFPRHSADPAVFAPISAPRLPLAVAGILALVVFLVANGTWNPADLLVDLFHEGEFLGFAPAFKTSARPFEHVFLIHGFAMNVLPALLGHDVAGARVVRMAEQTGTWIATLWLVGEAARSSDRRSPGAPALAIAGFCLLNMLTYWVAAPRSLVSFAQSAAALRILRKPDRSRVLAAMTGASLPFGFLYNYGEASASVLAFAVATAVATVREDSARRTWWRFAVPGAAAGGALFVAGLGATQVSAIASQVIYWARYGGWIWFAPLRLTPGIEQRFLWVLLAAHGWTLLHLWSTAREAGWREIAVRDGDLCVLFALSSGSLRGSLDRADGGHLGLGGMLATVLLVSLSLRSLSAARGWSIRMRFAAALLAACLVVRAWPQLDPRVAAARLAGLRGAAATDGQVVPEDVRSAVAAMRTSVARQRCFFTLDSAGAWYYLFDRPSCSRFHQLDYARTREAQREVVDALERHRPDVILFRNPDSLPDPDGPANGEHLVYSYVLRAYRPLSVFAGRWFWRRSAAPLSWADGSVRGKLATSAGGPRGTVHVTGVVEVPPGAQWAYATVGTNLLEIAPLRPLDGGRAAFDLLAPTAFLPPGTSEVEIAVHDPRTDRLLRVCSNC
jgi:hypothetical protein